MADAAGRGGGGRRRDPENGEGEEEEDAPAVVGREDVNGGASASASGAASEFDDWPDRSQMPDDGAGSYEDDVTDVDILRRVWCNEKAAPEILQYQIDLVERVQEQVNLMEENIAAMSAEIRDDLILSLYRMDVDRTLFLLRSYLRTRLSKIERYVMYILSSTELSARLSSSELEYADRYNENMAKHLYQTVLRKLPEPYQSLSKQSSQSDKDDMIPEPQLETFVFCRSKGAIGTFQLDDKGEETVDLMNDDLHILRYKPVKKLLESSQIEFI